LSLAYPLLLGPGLQPDLELLLGSVAQRRQRYRVAWLVLRQRALECRQCWGLRPVNTGDNILSLKTGACSRATPGGSMLMPAT
jgi:hypothetical protein